MEDALANKTGSAFSSEQMTSVEVVEGREDGLFSCLDDHIGVAYGVPIFFSII